jgi:predicted nucleotidyltransferase/HEPN domain-containing protein
MRSDLDQLPGNKRIQIDRILALIHEEFADSMSLAKHEWKQRAAILKIILYGSYARGDWVDEVHTAVGKKSDYDILIIVNDDRLTETFPYWHNLRTELDRAFLTHRLLAPAHFIVHSLDEVNVALEHGRYFFMDIAREGIVLYESDDTRLAEPKPKTPTAALKMAQEYYEERFTSAIEFLDTFEFSKERGKYKNAALQLHQCVEQLYQAVLLTCTFYTPYVHDLFKLREHAELVDARLVPIWPRENENEGFGKLQEAYVKSRYMKNFRIGAEQVTWLGQRVAALIPVVEQVCRERLALLKAATGA